MDKLPLGEAASRLRVVGDEIDGGVGRREGTNPLVRAPFRLLVDADAVDLPAEHQLLRIGAVAGEEDGVVALVDEHADLPGGVAGKGHERDVAGFGQAQALREGSERLRLELNQRWAEPCGPALVRDVAAQAATEAGGVLELRASDEDLVVGEVVQAAGVIGVQVSQHDPADVARLDAESLQLRADLLLRLDPLAKGAEARVPAREVTAR